MAHEAFSDRAGKAFDLPGLGDFAQQVGMILINGSSVEGAFQRLIVAASGVEERAASILTLHQSHESLAHALQAFSDGLSFSYLRSTLNFAAQLAKRCADNRNLFAHGYMTNTKIGNVRDGPFSSTLCVVKWSARGKLMSKAHFFSLEDLTRLAVSLRASYLYFSALGETTKQTLLGQLARCPERPELPPLLSTYLEDQRRMSRTLGFEGKTIAITPLSGSLS